MILIAIGYLISGALAQTGTKIALDSVTTDDDSSDFAGAWSVYPYFRSGLVAVSSIEEGLFLVKRAESRRRLRGARV